MEKNRISKRFRKVIALVISLSMLMGVMPIDVHADTPQYSTGSSLANTQTDNAQTSPEDTEFDIILYSKPIEGTVYKLYTSEDKSEEAGSVVIKDVENKIITITLKQAPTRDMLYFLSATQPGKLESRLSMVIIKAYHIATGLKFSYGDYSSLKYYEFYQDQSEYNIVLPTGTVDNASIAIYISTDNSAVVTYDGDNALNNGRGTITATVTAQEGTDLTYTYIVNFSTMELQGEGTQESPYLITTEQELVQLADCINSGAAAPMDMNNSGPGNYYGYYFKLTNDLDMSGIKYDPIGYSGECYFAGSFDGSGHAISNINCSGKQNIDPDYGYDCLSYSTAGVFGWAAFGTISELIVKNADMSATGYGTVSYAGGLMAVAYGCNVEKCFVYDSKIESRRTPNNSNFAGGIVGLSFQAEFTGCASIGNTVSHMSYGGGFIGTLDGASSYFSDCYVANSSVIGRSTGNGLWSTSGAFLGASQYGKAVLKNCYIYDCTPAVSEDTQSSYDIAGIFTAHDGDVTATDCYYFDESGAEVNCSTAVSMTKEQFSSGEAAYILQGNNTEDIWGQTIGTENYPVIGGKKVYQVKKYHSCDENETSFDIIYSNEQKDRYVHQLVKIEKKNADCIVDGADEYWICSKCNKMFSDENADNEIESIPVLDALGHDYGISVDTSEDGTSSSLVFTCKRENCKESDNGHRETVTITVPDKIGLTFDGSAKEATVTHTSENVPESIPEIVYTGDGLLNGKPVNAGKYTASITIGTGKDSVTASVTYEIAQATPVIGVVKAEDLEDTLDADKVKLMREDNTLAGTLKLKEGTELKYGTNIYTYIFTPDDSNYKQIEGEAAVTVRDTIAPTVSYKIGTDGWKKFVNTVTLGKFCKDYQSVEISYSDKAADGETDGSGIRIKQYYVSHKEIDNPQTEIYGKWKDYTGAFKLYASGTYFIYVRALDNAGNEIIQNSEGIVIYEESAISPSEIKCIYKESRDCIFNVTLNGNTFERLTDETGKSLADNSYTFDADGRLTLKAAYLDTLTPGVYTYKLYMNPQGVQTDKVELVYTFTVKNVVGSDIPYIKDDSGKAGWDIISEQIEAANNGETITVDMNGTTTVPSGIFEQIKGKDIDVVFDMDNGIQWTVTGKDVTDIKGDIDFGVTLGTEAGKNIPVDVINSITGECTSINITLAYNGEFGFKAVMTVNLEEKNAGYYANLFYYNSDSNTLEFVCAGQIGKDGSVNLTFTHASDYTIVISDIVMDGKDSNIEEPNQNENNEQPSQNINSEAPKTGDSLWRSWWIILICCVVIIIGSGVFFIDTKKKSE